MTAIERLQRLREMAIKGDRETSFDEVYSVGPERASERHVATFRSGEEARLYVAAVNALDDLLAVATAAQELSSTGSLMSKLELLRSLDRLNAAHGGDE